MLCGPIGNTVAQPSPSGGAAGAQLIQQNPLVADVAQRDPDGLWGLLRKLEILTTARRDGGTSRSASAPTAAEAAQIQANPALSLAYRNDPAATLALVRSTNEALRRAKIRDAQIPAKRLALVIGSNGDGTWGTLTTPRNDAHLIASALVGEGFELFEGHVLTDPDRQRLAQTIKAFSRAIGPETVAFFYYAGHGVQLNGRYFLVPIGAAIPRDADDYDRYFVALDDAVVRTIQQGNAQLNIVVIDACGDRSPLLSGRSVAYGPPRASKSSVPMNLSPHTDGTVIIYSTAPNDVARDSVGNAPNSPFASAFATAIGEPGLEVREVFDRVQDIVGRATDRQQQPWISYSGSSKFYFGTRIRPVVGRSDASDGDRPFHCPSPGSTVALAVAGGTVTGTYQVADQADPVLCRIVTSAGETKDLVYNFFDRRSLLDQASIRTAMDGLLSRQKDQAEFEVWTRAICPSIETWQRLGSEMIPIGNRYVRTFKFERTRRLSCSANFDQWIIWYDPTAGIFVRSMRKLPVFPAPLATDGVPGVGMPGVFNVISLGPS
jgi:hypothetical protein